LIFQGKNDIHNQSQPHKPPPAQTKIAQAKPLTINESLGALIKAGVKPSDVKNQKSLSGSSICVTVSSSSSLSAIEEKKPKPLPVNKVPSSDDTNSAKYVPNFPRSPATEEIKKRSKISIFFQHTSLTII